MPAMKTGFVVACSFLTGVLSAGCSPECTAEEPAYDGAATDEAWRVMLDARVAAEEGGDAPTFVAPATGEAWAAGASPAFAWESPLKLTTAPSPSMAPLPSTEPAPSSPRGPWRRRAPSWLERAWSTLVPSAQAHLPPVTSDLYLLEIEVPGRTCPVAALTSELSFTFDDEGWAAIAAGGGARTARLWSAFLTANTVTEGPFVAAPVTFTVTP
jgi:hypothetical protein